MIRLIRIRRCLAILTVVWLLPPGLRAQSTLTDRDVQQIVQQAVRTALANARVGNRDIAADSAIVFDTATVNLASGNGERRYAGVELGRVDVGRPLISGVRDAAFDCPAKDVPPRISADCTSRGNRPYVRVGVLDIIDANSVTLWVSIISLGNPSPKATRSERFVNHNVQILVKKGSDGWTIGVPKAQAVG